jgi:radical SAM protein with 4Fe4S-binding SPASM domain
MLPDMLNFIGKMTPAKLWNILVVKVSYFISILVNRPVVWGRPWFISIEPSSVCNLQCTQCPTGQGDIQRDQNYMDLDLYREFLKGISSTTSILSLYFQGEPLMHKNFVEFIRAASDAGMYTQTSTNGQMLDNEVCREMIEAGLDRIIISMDGLDPSSYHTYRRGGDLGKVQDGIRNLVRIRNDLGSRTPKIIVQFLVFRHNQGDIKKFRKKAKDLGTDRVWIKTAQLEYPETAGELVPDLHSRYERNGSGDWIRKGRLKNRCKRLWETLVVTSDGRMVPCCFDKRAAYSMGNIRESVISDIWKGESYRAFREKIFKDRKSIGMCRNCTEGLPGVRV